MTMISRRTQIAVGGAIALMVGGGAGALAVSATRPSIEMAPLRATAIRNLPGQTGIVTVRARVAETYGNKFVADDGTGRTLVDLGPAGDDRPLVADGQVVSAQGRFDRSVLHASFLVDAKGSVQALGPAGPPPPPHGRGPHGPPPPRDGDRAAPPPPPQDGGPDAPPPPLPAR